MKGVIKTIKQKPSLIGEIGKDGEGTSYIIRIQMI